jgi:hypothetical protein
MGEIGPRPGDPIGLLLNALAIGLLALYLLVDLAIPAARATRWKTAILIGIIVCAVGLPAVKLMLLRAQSGPASYTHDGGVIQTEATIRFLLDGKNPYTEDYTATPMAEWGFSQYRTALFHYPYLPWTFVFSAPFYVVGAAVGFYDQRLVYLMLYGLMLAAAWRLAINARARLALVAVLALNPIMALDVIFGQNDSFVLAWLLFSLAAWRLWRTRQRTAGGGRGWLVVSSVCFGLACASKPTAWFFAPFYGLLLVQDQPGLGRQNLLDSLRSRLPALPAMARRAGPALVVFGALLLPYLVWDRWSLYDDVWRWSNGQGATGYQIWGWGASNFVLAAGWVPDRFAQWPFWILEVTIALPLLAWFLGRQARSNTLGAACWHYGIFLLVFFYVSRFLNENYLGYILAFWAIGIFSTPWSLVVSPED